METLLRKRASVKGKCTRLSNNIDKLTLYDNATVKIYATQADELWAELLAVHDDILGTCDEKCIQENETEFALIADKIDLLKINITHMFKEEPKVVQSECNNINSNVNSHIKLPRLDLPTFSGSFSDWISFRDIFQATVHNNASLSNVQKLQYLKLSLKGEALTIIQNVQISDANYAKAWKLIDDRYENAIEIIYSTLDKLFMQPNLQDESAQGLRRLIDVTNQCLDVLEVMNQPIEKWDTILVYVLRKKLDSESLKEWHLSHKNRTLRSFAEFKEFLEMRASGLASVSLNKRGPIQNVYKSKPFNKNNHVSAHLAVPRACYFCKGQHPIYKCEEFVKLSHGAKTEFILKTKLCKNCLKLNHYASECTSGGCKKCNQKHNTLLHIEKNQNNQTHTNANYRSDSDVEPVVSTHCSNVRDSQVILPTAIVSVIDANGQHQKCRILIDPGSQSSFINEDFVQKLKLNRKNDKLRVSGVSGKQTATTNGSVVVNLVSYFNKKSVQPELHILKKVTCDLPQCSVDTKTLSCFDSLKLADPNYNVSGSIEILLGADFCSDVFVGNCIKAPQGSIAAHETIFGWVIFGKATLGKQRVVHSHHSVCDVDSSLQKFWQVEEVPNVCKWTKDEIQCDKHFQETHSRDNSGRYIVNLPFKQDAKPLGESREIAISRFKQLERRISRTPVLMQNYVNFMNDYVSLGHMEKVPDHEVNTLEPNYYIPHHCIKGESDLKFRVVFDASAKSSNGVSLNNNLLIGPTIQDNLFDIILKFREKKIALKADIAKMYRQVKVSPIDTNFQQIVWRDSPCQTISTYRLLTVTYGTASAPFLATRCLKQLVIDEGHAFPLAAQAVSNDFYVDDLISGTDTIENAVQLQVELDQLLKKGGFELRKWSSNEPKALQNVSEEYLDLSHYQVQSDNTIKTLGILWDPKKDVFLFKVSLNRKQEYNSKRTVLSMLSQLFDPLGWITPVTIVGKILIQMLWKEKLDWDDKLTPHLENIWNKFIDNLKELELVEIPRYILINSAIKYELHGFSDASEKAYAAAVYVRSITSDGGIQVGLIASKSKVSPLKNLTLPRLELCGAHLLAKLMSVLISGTNLTYNTTHCWCDSTIVLAWLDSPPNRWKTFIANRVAQINEFVPMATWQYVPSLENPADCASRGVSVSELKSHNLWWNGPPFLREFECISHEPVCTEDNEVEINREIKKNVTLTAQTKKEHQNIDLLQKYSSLSKLKRVTAYCFRFIKNCQVPSNERNLGFLTALELNHALMFWVKEVQEDVFSAELKALRKSVPLPAKSKILSLNPVLHDGLLKVGGRLRHANIPESQRRPILLLNDHCLTKLILTDIHVSHLHAGVQLMQACVRLQFWIVSAKSAIRRVIASCVVCKRHQAQRLTQQMGDLPAPRVNPSRPFTHCGVDYCGPFLVKISRATRAKCSKAYLALFICAATKAVHLELVSDLTTNAFIAALKRFISRRGKCSHIYSDCGSNFVGANRKLKAEVSSLLKSYKHNEEVSTYLSENSIQWHFNPPSAPHMGGLWESNIKCAKQHLRKIVSNVVLTFEELYTVFTQIEACLNSRPISPMSSEPNDLTALTPGHFIAGGPLTAIPEPDYTTTTMNRLTRWQLTQRLVQHFWNRWKKEYVLQLQQRTKWKQAKENLTLDDLVLIADDNLPPAKWKLGRVTSVHPGNDGKVRVVTMKTADGILSRAVAKLCKL